MATILVAHPAYGRSYDTTEACVKDYNEGKDFRIFKGPYFSIRDEPELKKQGYEEVVIVQPSGGVLMEKDL